MFNSVSFDKHGHSESREPVERSPQSRSYNCGLFPPNASLPLEPTPSPSVSAWQPLVCFLSVQFNPCPGVMSVASCVLFPACTAASHCVVCALLIRHLAEGEVGYVHFGVSMMHSRPYSRGPSSVFQLDCHERQSEGCFLPIFILNTGSSLFLAFTTSCSLFSVLYLVKRS